MLVVCLYVSVEIQIRNIYVCSVPALRDLRPGIAWEIIYYTLMLGYAMM